MEAAIRLKRLLIEFNLFLTHTPTDNDPHCKQIQLISTRSLISLLIISLTILLIYNTQLKYNYRGTYQNPSISMYLSLEEIYGEGLTCPCTNIAIERRELITLSPIFHQVCTSEFIDDHWINYLRNTDGLYVSANFGYTGSVLFTILASFCRLANETIYDAFPTFYSTRYVSSKVIDSNTFEQEMKAAIHFHISTITKTYTQSFDIIRDMNYIDALLSGLSTNFVFTGFVYIPIYSVYFFVPIYANYGECSCELSATCILPAKMSNGFIIPGFYTGCSLTEAVRRSNLICLYNQTCLDEVIAYWNSSSTYNMTALIQSNYSHFFPSTNISDVLDVLMVDAWVKNTSFHSYYQQCQPQYCTYVIQRRHDVIYIVTTSLGLFGGIYKVLLIIVPFICRFILDYRRKRQIQATRNRPVVCVSQISRREQVQQFIRSFNLFPSYPPSTDSFRLKSERLMTIIYLIMLAISVLVILIYNMNRIIIETTIVPTPSLDDYDDLYAKHSSDNLYCPCSSITSEYSKFLTLRPIYHQLCKSTFLQGNWMTYQDPEQLIFSAFDFRVHAAGFMHALAVYCSLSELTVSNDLKVFLSNSLINSELLTKTLFHNQTNRLVQQFTRSVGEDFIQKLDFLRINTYANQIISGKMTNFIIFLQESSSHQQYASSTRSLGGYYNCSCSKSPTCSTNMGLYKYNQDQMTLYFSIPGIRIGCYMNEALRQSTLECFYDQTCVNMLEEYLAFDNRSTRALDSTQTSIFSPTTVFDELIEHLLIEQWIWNDSYASYYHLCQPISCSYQIMTKQSFLIVLTILLGLMGGLIKVLQTIVPILVQLIRRPTSITNPRVSLSLNEYKDRLLQHLRIFNLFRTKTPLDDRIDQIQIQIISTRLFILLLVVALLILLSYNSQVEVEHTKTLHSPSFSSYLSFYEEHGDEVNCPCTKIVIDKDHFVSITPHFHQICSSDLIDPTWPDTLYQSIVVAGGNVYHRDFRFRSLYYFQSLQSICQVANRTVITALNNFYSSTLLSVNLLSNRLFEFQVNTTIDLFITSTTNTFSRSFRILQEENFNEQLFAATWSSFYFNFIPSRASEEDDSIVWDIVTRYSTYNGGRCSCRDASICIEPAYIYTTVSSLRPIFAVPGIFIGCYTFEALLRSNLVYFYNQTSIDTLCEVMQMSDSCNFRAMDPSKSDGYFLNESIEQILARAMINQWFRNVSYENYFLQCQPIQCQYTWMQKFDLLYIITAITALIGGLTSVLQFVVPPFVRLTRLYRCLY